MHIIPGPIADLWSPRDGCKMRVTRIGLRHVAGYFDSSSSKVPGRFVPMHFRSPERNDHTVNVRSRERNCLVGGPNIRSHELSSPTTVALLGSIGLLDTPCTIMSFLTMTIAYTI